MSEVSGPIDLSSGQCPGCFGEGQVGEPCPEKACHKHQTHFIPTQCAMKLAQAAPDWNIGAMVNDFLLVECIGAGGMGTVYLGLLGPQFRLKSAVKLMKM